MSLEKELAANTAALKENTEMFGKLCDIFERMTPVDTKAVGKGKPAKSNDKSKEPAASTENTEGGEDESLFEGDGEEVTLKDLQGLLKQLVAASDGDKSTAKKLLSKYKVAKIPDLPEEKYAEFKAACEKQIAAFEAAEED